MYKVWCLVCGKKGDVWCYSPPVCRDCAHQKIQKDVEEYLNSKKAAQGG